MRRHLSLRVSVAAAALGLLVAACGTSGEDQTIEPSPAATGTPEATPSPITETVAEPPVPDAGSECSAGDLMVTAVQPQGVTEAAAETWNAVRSAALDCDYDALAGMAGEDFSFSFGGGDDPATFWRRAEDAGEPVMADLVQILGLSTAEDDDGDFVWPRVHLDPEDDAAWEEIGEVYEPEDVSSWRESGAYLGYRTAIAPDGTWLYFVAGD